MAAIKIGSELDLVYGHESHIEIARHRLDRRHPEAGISRLDLFLAGDQRNSVRTDPLRDLIVDLAGQEPQRQSYQPRGMRQHALDCEMSLAGIGRPQHCRYAVASGTRVTVPG